MPLFLFFLYKNMSLFSNDKKSPAVLTVFFLSLALHDHEAAAVRSSKPPRARAVGCAARFLTAASFLAAGVFFAPDALRLGRPGGGGGGGRPLGAWVAPSCSGKQATPLLHSPGRPVGSLKLWVWGSFRC
jgi:hypothetical protein